MKKTLLALTLAALSCGIAQASVIKFEAANATSGFLGNAAAYQGAVDTALLGASYATQNVASYNNVTHASLFGGNSNFAMKSTVSFGLLTAGSYDFRAGVDFGFGGAMFLDGVAVDFHGNDMWWNGSYSNSSQYFAASASLAAGNHTLTIYGFEGCCDGAQQAQFRKAGQQFASFGATDGLPGTVPEPASIALLMTGVGLIGLSRRRKHQA